MANKKDPGASEVPGMPAPLSFVAPSNSVVDSKRAGTGSKAEPRPKLVSASFSLKAVRYLAYRCEINNERIRAIYTSGKQSDLLFSDIAAIVVRQLPEDSPWESKLMVDLVPAVLPEPRKPIRLFSTTYVNYAWLPQGASPSTHENLRRLSNFIAGKNSAIAVDAASVQFLQTGRNPLRFSNAVQFAEYDSRYES